MARYLRILSHRAAFLPFVTALLGRFPIAMTPLGMVLLVQEVRGSYSIAGLVAAMFALGTAVSTPLWGSLVDRSSQPRVIAPLSALSALFLGGLALAAVNGAGDLVLVAFASAVGLTFPPISPAMRGAWRVILEDDDDRRAAYALEAVVIETIFVAGPLVLSALLVLTAPVVPLLVTAALLGLGGIGYALTPAARAWRPEPHEHGPDVRGRSPLRYPGVLAVLLVAATVAVGFGQLDVALAALARETLGDQAKIGLLFMAIAGGSATGGLLYGARHWNGEERHRLPVVLGTFAAGVTTLSVLLAVVTVPSLVALMPLLFLTGLSIAPGLIVEANLVDRYAPGDRLNEAQSWLSTSFTSGGAAGNALAGVTIDAGGPARAFAGAAVCLVAATVAAVACQRVWRGPAVPVPAASASLDTAA